MRDKTRSIDRPLGKVVEDDQKPIDHRENDFKSSMTAILNWNRGERNALIKLVDFCWRFVKRMSIKSEPEYDHSAWKAFDAIQVRNKDSAEKQSILTTATCLGQTQSKRTKSVGSTKCNITKHPPSLPFVEAKQWPPAKV